MNKIYINTIIKINSLKPKLCIYSQPNYLTSRTAIEREQKQFIQIAFAVHLSAAISAERYRSDSGALKSAVLYFVFFMIIINKMQQSAKRKLLLNSPTDMPFGNRWSRYKEPSKNKAEAYRVYVEHLFLRSDAGDARIFSKEEDVYGIDYGFGLDAPKETEQANPQDLFAYRRNYTWNERNLLTKSSDRNFTVHYRYGDDGQRALKYTDEGRSETLYFNNFFTIHIPTQDQNNPQGLRVHKHIFVGNSRLVTAMTHTDNQGDNEEQKAKRYYYHSDHLGSAQFVTDWKGRQYEHIEYTPYGELWIEEVAAGLDKLPFRFTGKELDEETGLYYYGARYLDPKYSRWLSGDPALNDYIPKAPIDDDAKKHNENLPGMGGVFNTVNLHVYHYAGNNPVKYTDPDGRETKQSGKGTIDEPFIQITVTNAETDAYKYTTTINYTSYMDNGKIFEQYSINSSFLIKDTEAGTKLANDMNVGIDMGYTLISSILIAFTMKQIDGNNIAKGINGILAGISSYTGSKYVFKYESGMKIETNTELEVVSDSSGVINSGNRTTNVYKREREDSDGKPIITCTENLNY